MATKGQKLLDYYTKTWPYIRRSDSLSASVTVLINRMCPDSTVAKNYKCRRTKTTYIMNEMSHDVICELSAVLKETIVCLDMLIGLK